ncbi:MAG: sugar phosphate isomerase/epimerase family protein [Acidimicrobiales bacterium]
MTSRREMLWSATLGGAPLAARMDAAAANEFRGITVRPDDVASLTAAGRAPAEVAREARDRGIERLVVESFSGWYEHDPPRVPFPSADQTIDDHLVAARAFGASDVNVVAPFRTDLAIDDLAERFANVCDRFADEGVAVHLEFTPFRPIGSLSAAWQIVRDAGRPNGGILFDTWHFFRGEPDFDLLTRIPGDRIFAVQISDGAARLVESLVQDTFRHRLLPGEGVFDLGRVLRTLERTGGLNLVGPEVLSVELDALTPIEAARRAGEALDRVTGL